MSVRVFSVSTRHGMHPKQEQPTPLIIRNYRLENTKPYATSSIAEINGKIIHQVHWTEHNTLSQI